MIEVDDRLVVEKEPGQLFIDRLAQRLIRRNARFVEQLIHVGIARRRIIQRPLAFVETGKRSSDVSPHFLATPAAVSNRPLPNEGPPGRTLGGPDRANSRRSAPRHWSAFVAAQ